MSRYMTLCYECWNKYESRIIWEDIGNDEKMREKCQKCGLEGIYVRKCWFDDLFDNMEDR